MLCIHLRELYIFREIVFLFWLLQCWICFVETGWCLILLPAFLLFFITVMDIKTVYRFRHWLKINFIFILVNLVLIVNFPLLKATDFFKINRYLSYGIFFEDNHDLFHNFNKCITGNHRYMLKSIFQGEIL